VIMTVPIHSEFMAHLYFSLKTVNFKSIIQSFTTEIFYSCRTIVSATIFVFVQFQTEVEITASHNSIQFAFMHACPSKP